MDLKEKLEGLIASKNTATKYIEEAKNILRDLQGFMSCVLEAQDAKSEQLIQYLIGIIKDTNAGIENQDEVLLRDVLEYGWYRLIIDIMGEDSGDNI